MPGRDTGARYNTIRTLLWGNIDVVERCLKFGKDKTSAGTGRTVPLNQRALEVAKFWAQQFPNRLPEHYVFPAEKVGAAGDQFDAKVYETDPSKPLGSMTREKMSETQELMVKYLDLQNRIAVEDAFTNEFLS